MQSTCLKSCWPAHLRHSHICHYPEIIHDLRSPWSYQELAYHIPGVILPRYWSASLGPSFSQVWQQHETLDQQITSEVLGLLNQIPLKPSHIIETMFKSFYLWLPIIYAPNFIEQVRHLPRKPKAEIATLLLAIHLMNQFYAPLDFAYPETRERDCLGICQRFFTVLQLDHKERLETIQAGLLLSALQLHAGNFSEAALTVTTSVSLAYRLELHRNYVAADIEDSELRVSRRNTWCSIIFLDRWGPDNSNSLQN